MSRSSGAGVGRAQGGRECAHKHGAGPKLSISRPSTGQIGRCPAQTMRVGLRQIDHGGQQQRLGAHAWSRYCVRRARASGAHGRRAGRFRTTPGRRCGDDIGVQHLRNRRAKRVISVRGGHGRRVQHAAGGGHAVGQLGLGKAGMGGGRARPDAATGGSRPGPGGVPHPPAPPANARCTVPMTSDRIRSALRNRSSDLAGCTFTSSSSGGRSSHRLPPDSGPGR